MAAREISPERVREALLSSRPMPDHDEGRDFEAEVEAALAELARLYPVDESEPATRPPSGAQKACGDLWAGFDEGRDDEGDGA